MGRLWWDRPSATIRTEFFKPEKGRYLHPTAHRPITHREAARLMGFPDDFVFRGSKTDIARQIGNAVPPHLAAAMARTVAEVLSDSLELAWGSSEEASHAEATAAS
jgi:DNA (cytosine-5)-methyltransferase 1